jgi:isopenicillin-N N-acyltransferase-like protein
MRIGRRAFLFGAPLSRGTWSAAAQAPDPPGSARRWTHPVYDFCGTPFEIGLEHGRALSREIRAEADPAVAALTRRLAAPAYQALARVVSKYEGLFREYVPDALEEIRGMAEGARLSYPYAFFAATRDLMRTPAREDACTALAVSGKAAAAGGVLVGQTKDTSAPLDRYRILRLAYASGRKMIVLNYPGWIANLCLTSDGLTFTGNSLSARASAGDTAPGSLLKRLVMTKPSVQAVLEAIRGMRFENGCFLIGDRSGHVVCLECVAGFVDIRDVSGQAYGHANSLLAPELKRYETAAAARSSSPLRQKNVEALLRARSGALTVDAMKAILRDHAGFPLSICRHPSPDESGTTTAAFIADLRETRMNIAIGNPCVAPFREYSLPAA